MNLGDTLSDLQRRGVVIPDPRQVYIAADVLPERILAGAVLHPGTRLTGSRTFVGQGAKIGTEGPAVLDDAVFADGSEVASGYVSQAVLLGDELEERLHVAGHPDRPRRDQPHPYREGLGRRA